MTAGDLARVKIFAIQVPETPSSSSATEPDFSKKTPVALTHTGAAQGIQVLSDGRLLFTRSTLASPNDVFVIHGLSFATSSAFFQNASDSASKLKIEQLTKFTEDALDGKGLSAGEDFWFDGAEKKIHGFVVKPPGFKEAKGEHEKENKKKWPVLLLIHGGPQGAWEDQWSTRWNPNSEDFVTLIEWNSY